MRIADDTDVERVLGVRTLWPISAMLCNGLKSIQLTIREAEFLTELSHANIVYLEGFVEEARRGIVWLVFPWAENGNLKDFIGSHDWEIPERISLVKLMGLF